MRLFWLIFYHDVDRFLFLLLFSAERLYSRSVLRAEIIIIRTFAKRRPCLSGQGDSLKGKRPFAVLKG